MRRADCFGQLKGRERERAKNICYRNCYRTRWHGLRSERTGDDTKSQKAQRIWEFLGLARTRWDGRSRIRKPMLYPAELRGHRLHIDAPKMPKVRVARVIIAAQKVPVFQIGGGKTMLSAHYPDDRTRRPPIEPAVVVPLVPSGRVAHGSGRPVCHHGGCLRAVSGVRRRRGVDRAGAAQHQGAAGRDLRFGAAVIRIAPQHRRYGEACAFAVCSGRGVRLAQ
jgi:hypothetical protein